MKARVAGRRSKDIPLVETSQSALSTRQVSALAELLHFQFKSLLREVRPGEHL